MWQNMEWYAGLISYVLRTAELSPMPTDILRYISIYAWYSTVTVQ